MTTEERATQMTIRNAAIVAHYQQSHKLKDTASAFQLGRQSIMNILKKAGVWQPYVKGERTKFLGINTSMATKDALRAKADEAGISVSRLVSDTLDEMVAK